MSKCALAALLKDEVQNLNHLIQSLEDRSKLCYPNEYNCTKCLNKVIRSLRRLEKKMRKEVYHINTDGINTDGNNLFLNKIADMLRIEWENRS